MLLGFQHLYVSCREELEALLGCHVTADRDPENGRPGMTLWRVLVMAVLKQGLDCDYDDPAPALRARDPQTVWGSW